jgi:hypothetical protein
MSSDAAPIADGSRRVKTLKQELDDFYESYRDALRLVEINFQNELHKYACIRLAGFLEQVFFISVDSYVRATAAPKASSFSLSGWKKAPNLGPDALEKLVGRFGSEEWNRSLTDLIDGGDFKGDLGVLLKIRNDSAHGKSYRGSISSVDSYKNMIDQIYRWVLLTFLAQE